MLKLSRGLPFLAIAMFIALTIPTDAMLAGVSYSFNAVNSVPDYSLVSLQAPNSNTIVLANSNNQKFLAGIAIGTSNSLIEIDTKNTKIHVVSSGSAEVAVSTVNGVIKKGDPVGVSPFDGIGMLANPGDEIIGYAQQTFNGQSRNSFQDKVKTKSGQITTVNIGYIPVYVSIGQDKNYAQQLNVLQRMGRSLTGKTISTTRIIISLITAFVALVVLITLVYAAIYGSIISIGRNPLAKDSIYKTLAIVLVMVIAVTSLATVLIMYILQ